jgi:hypothetical protein
VEEAASGVAGARGRPGESLGRPSRRAS